MARNTLLRGWIVTPAVLLAFGHVCHIHAQTSYDAFGCLNNGYTILAQAKPIYNGHRIKAMGHTRAAARLVRAEAVKRSNLYEIQCVSDVKFQQNHVRGRTAGRVQTESESDAKLRAAQNILQRSRAEMSGKALDHVGKALKEISIALSTR